MYYQNPDGTFPTQDGKPVLVSEREFRECCCGTGCFCYWVYEWDCAVNNWVLMVSAKIGEGDVFHVVPTPYDQWNVFFFQRVALRENSVIRATYGTWIDCENTCTSHPALPSPNEAWREWKCDEDEPEEEPEPSDNKCQKLALYTLDCEEEEWTLEAVQIIGARLPAGTVNIDPDGVFWVYGKVFDCDSNLEDIPPDPGPPPGAISDYCPEDAPGSCPCASWPPGAWPCSDLKASYLIPNLNYTREIYLVEAGSVIVNFVNSAGSSCTWTATVDADVTNSFLDITFTRSATVVLTLVTTFAVKYWQFTITFSDSDLNMVARKYIDLIPPGSYECPLIGVSPSTFTVV